MSESELFYMPDPALFSNADAYLLYTRYAAELEASGLADRFPLETKVRKVAIEILAERYAVADVAEDSALIEDAIAEAREILEEQAEQF
jgi:hypothetical protein